jgi:IS4 transposase
METVTQVAEAMQYVLNEMAEVLGRESGFIQRKRKFTGASFVQTLVFGWLAKGHSSVEELSQSAANVGVPVSRQGLDDRFNQKAAEFLRQMVEASIKCVLRTSSVTTPVVKRFNGVYVEDSTILVLPDELASIWVGCQGSSLKISVRWDIQHGGLEMVQLQAGREHDQQALLHTQALPPGALQLRDLGYFDLETMRQFDSQDSYWVMRYKVGTALFTPDGKPLSLLTLLSATGGEIVECPIRLGAQIRLPCRLVAEAVTCEELHSRQKQLRQWERKHQRRASAEKWALLAWTIYLTNAPITILTAPEVLQVAGLRWQIELLFKLWKSEMKLDEWRSSNPWRILCEIYAKLIALIIQHWLMLIGVGHDLRKSLVQISRTIQKKAWHLASVLTHPQALFQALTDLERCFRAGCNISTSSSSPPSFQFFRP